MNELPCGALHGAELAVDADHADAAVVDESGPKVVAAAATDLGTEAVLGTWTRQQVYRNVYRVIYCAWLRACASICLGVVPANMTRSNAVRPLGFEPRTCGLRVRCSAVELEARRRRW